MASERPTVSESERTLDDFVDDLEQFLAEEDVALLRAAAARLRELETLLSAARTYIDASPCDPDITAEQKAAWQEYVRLLAHTKSEDRNG